MTKLVSDNAINAAVKELAKGTKKISKSVGEPNGIAPLDMEALIPRKHIPFPVLVISGTVSVNNSGVQPDNVWFNSDEAIDPKLWRLSSVIHNKKVYVGYAVSEDGKTFYTLWESIPQFNLPSSEDLIKGHANCLFVWGNSLYSHRNLSYIPVLDLDTEISELNSRVSRQEGKNTKFLNFGDVKDLEEMTCGGPSCMELGDEKYFVFHEAFCTGEYIKMGIIFTFKGVKFMAESVSASFDEYGINFSFLVSNSMGSSHLRYYYDDSHRLFYLDGIWDI